MNNSLENFFTPHGVAIIGASSNPEKLSHGILVNMIQYDFSGGIYPVNPGSSEISVKNGITGIRQSLKCYQDVTSVPDPVDLAVIVLPSKFVLESVEKCGQRGIRNITIISGGFREAGNDGILLEQELLKITSKYGIRVVGPNCVGTIDLYSGLNTTFIRWLPNRGPISFLSQSGAIIGGVIDYVMNKGGGFSKIASLGNEADVTETDMLEFLGDDPFTKVIAIYIEEIKDGQRFIDAAKRINRHKPIVILRAGNSEAGARAISSHTGSMAGSKAAYQAAFEQTGVLVVNSVSELFSLSIALSNQPVPKGNRIAMITNAGGLAAIASDNLSANKLSLSDLSQDTKEYLRKHLNPAAGINNPIDLLGGGTPEEYKIVIDKVLQDPSVDGVYALLVPHALISPEKIARVIGESAKTSDKTILTCIMGDQSLGRSVNILDEYQVPMFTFPELGGKVFRSMLDYAHWKQNTEIFEEFTYSGAKDKVNQCLSNKKGVLQFGEYDTRPILEAYEIPVIPGALAKSPEETGEIAQMLGYPVVLKIASSDILHKSDYGGIRFNILSKEQAIEEASKLITDLHTKMPNAILDGILVEAMAPKGHEVIIGVKRDPNFGPLIMFGLGGIFVELFNDVSFGIAPLNRMIVMKMINKTKAGKVLKGLRGQESVNLDTIIDIILKLSQLAIDFPQINEIEINPLLALPSKVVALDARMIIRND